VVIECYYPNLMIDKQLVQAIEALSIGNK